MSSAPVPLQVKWNKETLHVTLDPKSGSVASLKSELSEKTGVPVDRMKLLAKSKGLWKGVLKDNCDFATINWSAALSKANPLQLLLMGSATTVQAPTTKTVFLEDLPPEQAAQHEEPSGLINLGNTCYLNSVVQCLRAVPALRQGLAAPLQSNSSSTSAANNNVARVVLTRSLADTLGRLDRQSEAVQPVQLVQATQLAFPQFAQTAPGGPGGRPIPMQQDAEEFYSQLLTVLADQLSSSHLTESERMGAENLIDAVFGLKLQETLTCDELPAGQENQEATVVRDDLARKLVCNIQGGADGQAQQQQQQSSSGSSSSSNAIVNVSHIAEGINLSLNGKIEKHSDVLGRDAVWSRRQRIARLPPIVAVQFGRFYWKATPDSQDHAGVKCKVMKPVAFNSVLDVYDFCTDDIQKLLKAERDKALQEEEDRINAKLQGKESDKDKMETEDGEKSATAATTDEKMETEEKNNAEDDEDMKAALAMSLEEPSKPVGPGLPDHFQGYYELFAVVTHKGRDADGGHYMAWVKAENGGNGKKKEVQKIADTDEDNEDWYVFDDDEVSPCKTEDVLKLKGGGDWHMAYLSFYRAKK